MGKRHHGSSLDSLLKQEGVYEEAQSRATKEVAVWQLTKAAPLKASRSQVDRLPDPTRNGTNRKKSVYTDYFLKIGYPHYYSAS